MSTFGEGLSPDFDWAAVREYVEFRNMVLERYPNMAWALDHPELGPVLSRAAGDEEWTEDKLVSELEATQWWRERTQAQREWDIWYDSTNEAEITDRIEEAQASIADQASQLGVTLGPEGLYELTVESLRNGYGQDELTGHILSRNITDDFKPGDITANRTRIRSVASDYFVDVDDATVNSMALKLIRGEMTPDGITEYIRNIAKQRFPTDQIVDMVDKGVSLREYFQPHRAILAEGLGRSIEDIDLTSEEFRPVMSLRGKDGTVAPMTLDQTNRYVRTLDSFWDTRAGQAEKHGYARNFLRLMGMTSV